MPMEIHPMCKERLLHILGELYARGELKPPYFAPDLTTYEIVEKAARALPSSAAASLSGSDAPETILTRFVLNAINDAVQSVREERWSTGDDSPVLLSNLFPDPRGAAEALIASFESLPWRYTVLVPTPFGALDVSAPVSIGPLTLEEVTGCEDQFPLEYDPLRQYFSGVTLPRRWEGGKLYLRHTFFGYVTTSYSDPLVEKCKNLIKAFFGFCLATNACRLERRHFGPPITSAPMFLLRDGARPRLEPVQFSHDEATTFRDLTRNSADVSTVSASLAIIARAFTSSRHDALVSAARWYFDSFSGSNDLLNFIQATTALEILLGGTKDEAKEVGVTALLANRCAYLIARSDRERREILATFRTVYETRSQIVHRGKWHLNAEEQRHLRELRQLCKRALLYETNLAAH